MGESGGDPADQLGDGTPSGANMNVADHTIGTYNPTNGAWHHVEFIFEVVDDDNRLLTVRYTHSSALGLDGRPIPALLTNDNHQEWTKNLNQILEAQEEEGIESYAFAISAATGYFFNDQRFRIIQFCYSEPSAEFYFEKVDDKGYSLEDAEFQLYELNEDDDWIPIGPSVTSDVNGNVSFDGLRLDHTYKLREISAPDDFMTPTGHWYIHVDENGEITVESYGDVPDFILDPEHGNSVENRRLEEFYFEKVDDEGNSLEGAEFQLYMLDEDDEWIPIEPSVRSGVNGIVRFEGLRPGHTYRLRETEAPVGFETPEGHWYIDVDDGIITIRSHGDVPSFVSGEDGYSVENDPIEPTLEEFEFTKVDDEDRPLEDAKFQLYERDSDEDEWVSRGALVTSNEDGRVRFIGLRSGHTYRLREVEAPDGFITPAGHWYIIVAANGSITIESSDDDMPDFVSSEDGYSVENEPLVLPPLLEPPTLRKTSNVPTGGTVRVGQYIEYTLTVTNPNSVDLADHLVVDNLAYGDLVGVRNISVAPDSIDYEIIFINGELHVILDHLPANSDVTITFEARIANNVQPGRVVNIARLYGPEDDDGNREEIEEDDVGVRVARRGQQENQPGLPQTGAALGSLLLSGLILVISGLALTSKKKKDE